MISNFYLDIVVEYSAVVAGPNCYPQNIVNNWAFEPSIQTGHVQVIWDQEQALKNQRLIVPVL